MTRALVTGGSGFLGSHLCTRLVDEGWDVVAFDSFLTGDSANVAGLQASTAFTLEERDVTGYISFDGELDWIFHLASPASPVDYLEHPIHTLKVGALGTLHSLGLAKATGASFFLASTSEVYGDPKEHPQTEDYWGNVNPIGPRGVYDEAKRFAEALTCAYQRTHGVDVRIVRIFNTYGERMRRNDGRAVPTFIDQALRGEALTVHGDGTQTRSLCYVDDLIEGFWRLANSDVTTPVNIGNPEEVTVLELAEVIRDQVGGDSDIKFIERPVDDPEVRCPDISKAKDLLGWEPKVSLREGLEHTIAWATGAWSSGP